MKEGKNLFIVYVTENKELDRENVLNSINLGELLKLRIEDHQPVPIVIFTREEYKKFEREKSLTAAFDGATDDWTIPTLPNNIER